MNTDMLTSINIQASKHRVASEDNTLQDMFLTFEDKPLVYTTLWIALKTILCNISEEDVERAKKEMRTLPPLWRDAHAQLLQGDPRWLNMCQVTNAYYYTRHGIRVIAPLIYTYLQDIENNFPKNLVLELKKTLGTNDVRTLAANPGLLLKLKPCIDMINQLIGKTFDVDEIYVTALFKEALGEDRDASVSKLTQYTLLLQLLGFISTITQQKVAGQKLITDVILHAETILNRKYVAGNLTEVERSELDFLIFTMYRLFQRKYIIVDAGILKKVPFDKLPFFTDKNLDFKDMSTFTTIIDKLSDFYGREKFNLLLATDAGNVKDIIGDYPVPSMPSVDMVTWLTYAKEYQVQSEFLRYSNLKPSISKDVTTSVFTHVLTSYTTREKEHSNTLKTIKKVENKLCVSEGVIKKLKESTAAAQNTQAHKEIHALKKQLEAVQGTVKLRDQKILKLQNRLKAVEAKQVTQTEKELAGEICEITACAPVTPEIEAPVNEADFEQLLAQVNAYSYYVVGGHERVHLNLQMCLSNAKYVKVEEHPRKKSHVVDYLVIIADAVKHSQVEHADKATTYKKKIFVNGSNMYNIIKNIAAEIDAELCS